MNKLLKLTVPVILFTGIVLLIAGKERTGGLFLVYLALPILLVYLLIVLKGELKHYGTRLKFLLIPAVVINLVFLVLERLTLLMHYPGHDLLLHISVFMSIACLIVGLIYFIANRKSLTTTFTFELLLLLFPAVLFIWNLAMPPQVKAAHAQLVKASTLQLERINEALKDSTCTNLDIEKVMEYKSEIIRHAGGRDISGGVHTFFNQTGMKVLHQNWEYFLDLPMENSLSVQLQKCEFSGDAIFILTQIENALIVRNCLQVDYNPYFPL